MRKPSVSVPKILVHKPHFSFLIGKKANSLKISNNPKKSSVKGSKLVNTVNEMLPKK